MLRKVSAVVSPCLYLDNSDPDFESIGGLNIAFHGLAELRVYFVGYGHDADHENAEIDGVEVSLQVFEDADLEDPGFFHHHGGGIALAAAGGAVFNGGFGFECLGAQRRVGFQTTDKVSKDLREMSTAKVDGHGHGHDFRFELDAGVPVVDDFLGGALKDGGDTFNFAGRYRSVVQALFDNFKERQDIHGLDENFIGLQKDGVGSSSHFGEGAEQEGDCFRIGVSHGADDREAVAGSFHVQVAQQHVKRVGADEFQSVRYIGRSADEEAMFLEDPAEAEADRIVVIDE